MKQMAQAAVESMGWPILEPIDVEGFPRPVAINKDVCVVGTRSEVNLKLSSKLVSRTHAIFVADRDSIYLRDLASRNHTYLNDKPIREAVLRNGDVIGVGPLSFRCKSGFDKPYESAEVHAPAAELRSPTDGKRIALDARSTLIGSRSDCDVVLPGKDVEPSHAIIFEREGSRFIRDLRTVSGTWVNEMAVGQAELNPGDRLRIADAEFVYQIADAEQFESTPESAADLPLTEAAVEAPLQSRDEIRDAESEEDEQTEFELADDTIDHIQESVGLSEWEAEDLVSHPASEEPIINGAIPSEPAPPAAEERDVIPIRLEELSQETAELSPEAAAAAGPAPDDVRIESSAADVAPEVSATALVAEAAPTDAPPEGSDVNAESLAAFEDIPEERSFEPLTQSISAAAEPARREDSETASAPSADAHPGQQGRPAPEEKLTELLGELAENIAEVQSTWEEVRGNKDPEEPEGARPGSDHHGRNGRGDEKHSDEPPVRSRSPERGAAHN